MSEQAKEYRSPDALIVLCLLFAAVLFGLWKYDKVCDRLDVVTAEKQCQERIESVGYQTKRAQHQADWFEGQYAQTLRELWEYQKTAGVQKTEQRPYPPPMPIVPLLSDY